MSLPKRDWMEMTWREIDGAGAATARWIAVLPLGRGRAAWAASAARRRYLHRRSLSGARARHPAGSAAGHLSAGAEIGVSVEHLAYPGTLTVSAATAIAAWTEIGESLARAGLRKLVLVTSHGGNVAAMESVARDLRARRDMLAVTVGWHRFGYPEGTFSREEKRHGIHGGDIETSLMLAAKPETVRMDKRRTRRPATVAMAQEFKWLGAYRPAGFAWMTQDLNSHRRGRRRDAGDRGQGRRRARARRAGLRGIAARDRSFRSWSVA